MDDLNKDIEDWSDEGMLIHEVKNMFPLFLSVIFYVGQEWGKFRQKTVKVRKRRIVKNIEAKIGNSRLMRLFAAGIFKKMIYWTFRMTKMQILICESNWNRF